MLPELQRNKNTVRCALLGAEVSRHHQTTTDANLDCAFVENVYHRSLILKSQQNRKELVTRPGLFQTFFTGRGKAVICVNVSQDPNLFDESIQVLKFAAIASKVTVDTSKIAADEQRNAADQVWSICQTFKC